MDYARIGREGRLVEATRRASRRRDYRCPVCAKPVDLRVGRERAPHFAHRPGEGTARCELYHPGSGGGGGGTSHGTDDRRAPAADLIVDVSQGWALLLKVPELSAEAVARTPIAELEAAGVIAKEEGHATGTRVSLIELIPGTGRSRVQVAPGTDAYTFTRIGTWPATVPPGPWEVKTPGLNASWTFFRQQRGEWTRVPQGGGLEWGEALYALVPDVVGLAPPTACAAKNVGKCARWTCWWVRLPSNENRLVDEWLERAGYYGAPPSWKIVPITPFTGTADDVLEYAAGEPFVVRLSAPGVGAVSELRLQDASGREATLEARCPRDSGITYALARVTASGENDLSMPDAYGELRFKTSAPMNAAELRAAIASLPRLSVRIGDHRALAWGAPVTIARPPPFDPEIAVEIPEHTRDARCRLAWTSGGRRTDEPEVPAHKVPQRIAELLELPDRIDCTVDAGALGSVRLTFEALPLVRSQRAVGEVAHSGWLRARAARGRAADAPGTPEMSAARIGRTQSGADVLLAAREVPPGVRQVLRALALRRAPKNEA